jgi:ankyrin repeat protein
VVKESLDEARRSIWVLRPQALSRGLVPSIETLRIQGSPSVDDVWLELGADFTIVDHVYNNSPVGLAAYCQRQNVVDLFRVTCAGRLSLEDLIAIGDLAEIEAAIVGMDINARPPGSVAGPGVIIRDAAVYGRADVVKLLLARGADRTLTNPSGQTAYDLAVDRGFHEIVDLLKS